MVGPSAGRLSVPATLCGPQWPGPDRVKGTYLIICGTVTLEFSSKAFIMSPLHRMLSTHWNQRGDPISEPPSPSGDPGPVGTLPSEPFMCHPHPDTGGQGQSRAPLRRWLEDKPQLSDLVGVSLTSLSLSFST